MAYRELHTATPTVYSAKKTGGGNDCLFTPHHHLHHNRLWKIFYNSLYINNSRKAGEELRASTMPLNY
jgi:hypothetical protein